MSKWKLFVTSLPYVAVALAVKLGLVYFARVTGFIEFSDIALVLTGGIFLIGFMLAGTMADYKESEKIPGQIACSLELIEESIAHVIEVKNPAGFETARKEFRSIVDGVFEFFTAQLDFAGLANRISVLTDTCTRAEKSASSPHLAKIMSELGSLRAIMTRTWVIKRTNFIAYGYALLEVLLGSIFILLMIAVFKTLMAEVVVIGFVSLIYVYMYRLIRDIDDPFDYQPDAIARGSEIELFPFLEYRDRLSNRKGPVG